MVSNVFLLLFSLAGDCHCLAAAAAAVAAAAVAAVAAAAAAAAAASAAAVAGLLCGVLSLLLNADVSSNI